MTTLYVPLHLPVAQAKAFLSRELSHRRVLSVKVTADHMVVEHRGRRRAGYVGNEEYDHKSIML